MEETTLDVIPTEDEKKLLEDTFPNATLEDDDDELLDEDTQFELTPAGEALLTGGFTVPPGYCHIQTVSFSDQEDDSIEIPVSNVLPNAAKDHKDGNVSLAFNRAPVDGSYGILRVRKVSDTASTIHVFRKDEDGTTTFTLRTAHGQ